MKNFVFYLGLGFLLTHEMDAMPNHEWRILPILKSLPDNTAELTFLLAHVPILALLIAFVASLNLKTRFLAQRIACGFLILHAALHFTFSGNSSYEFSSPVSTLLIFGAALCGIAFFLTLAIESKQMQPNNALHLLPGLPVTHLAIATCAPDTKGTLA